jgi:hypothetical protein
MKLIDAGDGMFIDPQPVAGPVNANIYAYAQLHSLERVSYGLMLTKGGPEDEEIESMKVGGYGMESLAPFWEFGDALKVLKQKGAFEEVPLVEVESEEDYLKVLKVLRKGKNADEWKGSGLYDFHDTPPTYAGQVEEYELDEMRDAAEQAIEVMFQGDEWENICRELAAGES